MKTVLALYFFLFMTGLTVHAQEKGVDHQTDRIRDAGSERAPASNGVKQNVGSGSGINFGKGRTPTTPPVPNPYRFTARRDAVVNAVEELMKERDLILDTAGSKSQEGVFISQPFRFVKGAVVAQTELNRYAEVSNDGSRGWTQGRYTIIVEVQPIDGTKTNVSVNARIEGRSDGAAGAEWVSLKSSGLAEQEFLNALVEKITGVSPSEHKP